MSRLYAPIYVEREDGTEVEYEATIEVSGKDRPATFNDPAEYAEVEVIEIRNAEDKVVPEAEWEAHGLTEDILETAKERALERAGGDDGGCRCRGESCRC